jgi:hypothetical protein
MRAPGSTTLGRWLQRTRHRVAPMAPSHPLSRSVPEQAHAQQDFERTLGSLSDQRSNKWTIK